MNGESEYKVKLIRNLQCYKGICILQYLIHWKGYLTIHNSWKNAINIHMLSLVKDKEQHRCAISNISAHVTRELRFIYISNE